LPQSAGAEEALSTLHPLLLFIRQNSQPLASTPAQQHYPELLHRSSQGSLTREEQYEFGQFELIEMLLQYVKARIRAEKKKRR
jgi:hypothetical protein